MTYAIVAFLLTPAWLAADEQGQSAVAPAQVEAAVETVQEVTPAVPELPLPAAADAQAPDEPAGEPAAEEKAKAEQRPEAEREKTEKKQEPRDDEPTAKAAASASVTISDFKFTPDTVTVNEGDTVTWTNDGPTVHTATAEDGSFDTGILEKGESGSATFTQAGTINYICSPHPNMHGKVVVQAASTGGGGSGGGSDTGSTDDDSAVAGEETSSSGDGSGLPSTGGETLSILLLGAATLGFGVLMRRRRET
jgi:LPXTG-motif cell wall-anchored protein